MRKKTHYILFSLSIILVWVALFLNAKRPGLLGVLIGLAYTFYANIYFKDNENRTLKIIKYVLPFAYLFTYLSFLKKDLLS